MFFILLNFLLLLIVIKRDTGLIDGMIRTALWMSLVVLGYSELMSLFNAINELTLVATHVVLAIVLVTLIFKNKINPIEVFKLDLAEFKKTPIFIAIVLFAIFIFVAASLSALIYPPNTSDSMTYHMPRIMQWMQNATLAHFPTHSLRQLYIAPFAEILSMNFMLVGKNDTVCNFAQWFSFIGCCLVMFELTKLLGGNLRAQFFAFLLTATIPMAILQASGTQTDVVVSFFICSTAYFLFKYFKDKSFGNLAAAAVATGLAVLTKGTAYFFLTPFMLWLLFVLIKNKSWKRIVIFGLVVLGINFCHLARNYDTFSTLFVPVEQRVAYQVETLQPNYLFVNLLRTTTYNTTVGNAWLSLKQMLVIKVAQKVLKVEDNSKLITFPDTQFKLYLAADNELTTGNVYHFAFFILLLLTIPFIPRLKAGKQFHLYLTCLVVGFVLFGILVKWQPWGSRLLLPVIILGCAGIARFMEDEKFKPLMNGLVLLFFAMATQPLLFNLLRPLAIPSAYNYSRIEHLFNNRQPELERFERVYSYLTKLDEGTVGLVSSDDQYEYPIWVFLKGKDIKIQHINVKNETKKLSERKPYKDFKPKYTLVLK